jgi:hypothetical protein
VMITSMTPQTLFNHPLLLSWGLKKQSSAACKPAAKLARNSRLSPLAILFAGHTRTGPAPVIIGVKQCDKARHYTLSICSAAVSAPEGAAAGDVGVAGCAAETEASAVSSSGVGT